MLDIRLFIDQIGYRSCVEAMLPPVVEYCASAEHPSALEAALAALGPDAVPAACAVLDKMEAGAKDRMVVWLILAHEEQLRDAANRALEEVFGGTVARIGYLLAQDHPGGGITLLATQIRIDYDALLHNPAVKSAVEQLGGENALLKSAAKVAMKVGARMSPGNLEKYVVSLLNSERVKSRLMAKLTRSLRKAGLEIQAEDMAAESNTAILLPETLDSAHRSIPDTFEKGLIDALNAQLQKLRGERNP